MGDRGKRRRNIAQKHGGARDGAGVKVVGARLYGAMAAASAQVAAAAPRCALPARPARPARERCPLACAGVASGAEGGQWEAALQLPAVDGCLVAPKSRCMVH